MLCDSLHDLLTSGPSSCEKHLDKFFKICHMGFWGLKLATCSRLILVAKKACFAQYFQDSFQKLFVFPSHLVTIHCLVRPSLFENHHFHTQNPPFSSSFLYQSPRKGMGFLLFSKYFMFLALEFLDFVFLLRFENMMLEYGLLMFCCV